MNKILGLFNIRTGEWTKLAYFHSNSEGKICVNGEALDVFLHRAGETMRTDADFAIVLPKDFHTDGEVFFAVNSGECLLKLGDGLNKTDKKISVINPGFIAVSSRFEIWRKIRAGVLTISDKGARGERKDTAGPALADLLGAIGCEVEKRDIIPDDRSAISDKIKEWADTDKLQIIVTTGGTGLAERDVTPEALMDIHEKVVPGFGETMRNRSMLYTERGFLTRSIAVVRGKTLIIAFPGSERAVRQCFEAITPALRHGVEILCGWDSECGQHRH